ncbi:MAG TPA: saccharopine dehydrogenase NADP-binding domain-containing protein [Thermoanaerobaculia bacterium]|nr:saccharopine dehydrogenase NADP-binding domain-containing protein [Thermoanaerobaculia bacterium]
MKRVVVLGGTGFFGRLIVEKLQAAGIQPLVASRSSSQMRVDANNADDLRNNLKPRDLVVDAAGPFQKRNSALIDVALRIGVDVVDISDSADYTSMIYQREAPIGAAGIRVLTACSSLSTVSAAVVKSFSVAEPRRVSAYLVPAGRYTANPATLASVIASVQGKWHMFNFPKPLGSRAGVTVKSVDAVTLPRLFPTLRSAELVVDLHIPGANLLLYGAAKWPAMRQFLERHESLTLGIGRTIGLKKGVLAYEISTAAGFKYRIFTGRKSYMLAVIPAIQAALAIAEGRFQRRGLVPPTEHVDTEQLFDAARKEGIATSAG